jgi:hypothetical protein
MTELATTIAERLPDTRLINKSQSLFNINNEQVEC